MTSKAPSSPTETTAGSEQRPDHTGVIRGADEAETRLARYDAAMTLSHEDYTDALSKVMAVADAEHAALTAEVERLTYDRNHPYGDVANVPDFVGADLGLDDDQDAVERLRQARRLAALMRQKP